jgi:putative FmdB family regulatory protein
VYLCDPLLLCVKIKIRDELNMPTYGYKCSKCKKEIEVLQKITDAALTKCPTCDEDTLVRGPGGGIGLQFTGTGFYVTDYPRDNNSITEKKGSCCPCGKNNNNCSNK